MAGGEMRLEDLRVSAHGGAPTDDLVDRVRRINRENERLFERLLEGERRFRSLARAVWEVQEEERGRIARELHDGLGQVLTALKIRLERLAGRADSSPELAEEVGAAVEIAGHALAEARRLAHLLRPQMLDDLGLAPALRWLCRTLGEWTGFAVELELNTIEEDDRLSRDLETLAFRVVQEALTNSMKHSGTTSARVLLERRAGRLFVRISDRGDGFDPALAMAPEGRSRGFGLRGMRDRVELAGGRLQLRSRPGEGTVLEVEVPVDGGDGAEEG